MIRTLPLCILLLATCGDPQPAIPTDCQKKTVFHLDTDGDGHGADLGDYVEGCLRPGAPRIEIPAGYALTHDDCADWDARAFPGQTAFQTTRMGSPGGATTGLLWDFNCDGREELQYPVAPSSCPNNPTCAGATPDGFWQGTTPTCGGTGVWISRCVPLAGACVAVTEVRTQGCL